MKILYYDCFSGISGDMNLGALVDLGVDQSYLIQELKKLGIQGYSISFTPDQRKGITGTRADVNLTEQGDYSSTPFKFEGLKKVADTQIHHHQKHNHGRNYADIRKLIDESSLNNNIKKISIAIFQKVAEAEAHVHGKSVDEVHFHEVGAVDSIVDIVGAAICIDYLNPDKIISSPVQLGGGMVKCAHGIFPVPAPATAEILKGKPVKLGAVPVETTTPTGAAILAVLVNEFTDRPDFSISKIAYGIGHRDNDLPNVLRVCLAESGGQPAFDYLRSTAVMFECNIDDMNPEMYEYIMDKLFEAGADDVYFQPIIMKKTRPGTKISVLCQHTVAPSVENILLQETSTLGLRKYEVQKTMLKRDWKTVETKWGTVRVKLGLINGVTSKTKPEYVDCLRIARENNIPITDVYKEITFLLNNL
ncbi:MAG TPA: nickel pincer cofactor biosynthesis protein LarC [Bacteroidales bacterium]